MKAIILAAGMGSRLRPITDRKPKCLVTVAGRAVLDHQLRALDAAGVRHTVVVTGYRSDAVREFLGQHAPARMRVDVVENHDFNTTNNMYSLYLADTAMQGECLLLNGDVVFDPGILADLARAPEADFIAADCGTYFDESMKISLGADGRVVDIGKTIPQRDAFGCSIDLYRFSNHGATLLLDIVRSTIERDGKRNEWTEVAIQRLVSSGSLYVRPFDVGRRAWVEIDNLEDLSRADRLFSRFNGQRLRKKLLVIDLDGTVYVGDRVIREARDWLIELEKRGLTYYFVSNNSSRSKRDYVLKLRGMGIATTEDRIVLSTDGLVEHLRREGIRSVFVLGTASMRASLEAAGVEVSEESPDCVVVGYDTELTYAKLQRAALLLNEDRLFLATHCDVVCPTPRGPVPDIGSLLALLEAATGRRPDKVFGKPNEEMIAHLLSRHGVEPCDVAVIGDRLYTDFELARRVGCDFILVLSGETRREDLEMLQVPPSLVVSHLGEIAIAVPGEESRINPERVGNGPLPTGAVMQCEGDPRFA